MVSRSVHHSDSTKTILTTWQFGPIDPWPVPKVAILNPLGGVLTLAQLTTRRGRQLLRDELCDHNQWKSHKSTGTSSTSKLSRKPLPLLT